MNLKRRLIKTENSKDKKKCYEVTYHFTNGEVKSVVYDVDTDKSKEDFTQFICCNYTNKSTKFLSDKECENVINMNYVCFFEIRELAAKWETLGGVVYTDKII